MNGQLINLIAQAAPDLDDLRKRTEDSVLPGTVVPESSLYRDNGMNFFGSEYWFPEQASDFASKVDYLYMGVFWISLVFFVGIIGLMVYFCFKYRRRGNEIAPQPSSSHNTSIEILWSVIPSILMVWIFYEGAVGYFNMRVARPDAEEIQVVASQFNWVFTYPDGDSSSELHLVRDKPALLIMQSKDVLHSLYVPAFRQKVDVVPGRYTYCYILPTKTGQYRLSCTEYCGEGHSKMRTLCEVHVDEKDRKDNTKWIKADHQPWENGQRTYQIYCSGCHKIDGQRATGPALNLLWASGERPLHDGSTVKVDEQYIKDSIEYPDKHIVAGFGPPSQMNSFKGILSAEDINEVIAFIKYLADPKLVAEDVKTESPEADEEGKAESPGEVDAAKAEAGKKAAEEEAANKKLAEEKAAEEKAAEEKAAEEKAAEEKAAEEKAAEEKAAEEKAAEEKAAEEKAAEEKAAEEEKSVEEPSLEPAADS